MQRGKAAEAPGVPYSSWVAALSLLIHTEQSIACDLGLTSSCWIKNDKVQCSAVPLVAPYFSLTTCICIIFTGPRVFHKKLSSIYVSQTKHVSASFCLIAAPAVCHICAACVILTLKWQHTLQVSLGIRRNPIEKSRGKP